MSNQQRCADMCSVMAQAARQEMCASLNVPFSYTIQIFTFVDIGFKKKKTAMCSETHMKGRGIKFSHFS